MKKELGVNLTLLLYLQIFFNIFYSNCITSNLLNWNTRCVAMNAWEWLSKSGIFQLIFEILSFLNVIWYFDMWFVIWMLICDLILKYDMLYLIFKEI